MISNNAFFLNNPIHVQSLLRIEFQAEQAKIDTKNLHRLILQADAKYLDMVQLESESNSNQNSPLIKEFPRLYLTLRSSYFTTMLKSGFIEAQTKK